MASLNMVQLIGYLGSDPQIKSGDAYQIASLSLATDESYTDSKGNKVQKTEWHRVIVRDKLAEICAKYLHKGSLVYVEGKIATRKYTDNSGDECTITEIRAFRIQFFDRKEERQADPEKETHPDKGHDSRSSESYGRRSSRMDEVPF